MEEQLKKNKTAPAKRPRLLIVFGGFAVLLVAMVLVAVFTAHTVKNHERLRIAVVRITKTGFQPTTISVKRGTTVIWINADTGLHQVASNPYPQDNGLANLKSEILNNNQTYEYTANTAGTFGYHDNIRPTTNGTLVVQKQ